MLTGLTNSRVKRVRALQSQRNSRERDGHFVLEGVRLIEEALQAGSAFDFVFHTGRLDSRSRAVLAHLTGRGIETVEVSPQVMQACSDTKTPQGLLAVVAVPAPTRPPASKQGDAALLLICDRISDPGNLGALLRSAAAANAGAALLAPGTVDAYNPKVVRSGMGAHFKLSIQSADWDQIADRTRGLHVRLANKPAVTRYDQADWTQPSALIVCNEADGPSAEARACAQESVYIPMIGDTESLNAAIAGNIILFEAVRQRLASDRQPAAMNRPRSPVY